jgi:hypothetical protein
MVVQYLAAGSRIGAYLAGSSAIPQSAAAGMIAFSIFLVFGILMLMGVPIGVALLLGGAIGIGCRYSLSNVGER